MDVLSAGIHMKLSYLNMAHAYHSS